MKKRELYFIFGSSFYEQICRRNVMQMLDKCCKCIRACPILQFGFNACQNIFFIIAIYVIVILCLKTCTNWNEAGHIFPWLQFYLGLLHSKTLKGKSTHTWAPSPRMPLIISYFPLGLDSVSQNGIPMPLSIKPMREDEI